MMFPCQQFRALFLAFIGVLVLTLPVRAATLADVSDNPTSIVISTVANHLITLTTVSAYSDGETLTITFPSAFDTSEIVEDDVDVTDDGVDLTTAATCGGTEQMSVAMASDVLTLTVCAGDGGTIAAGSVVVIEIGLNASSSGSGLNRIVNPTAVGSYFLPIGGTFGDSGSIIIATVTDDDANVSFVVPVSSTSGGGASSTGGGAGSPSGGDTGTDTGEDTGTDTETDPGAEPDPGDEPGLEPGELPGMPPTTETGGETGAETGGETSGESGDTSSGSTDGGSSSSPTSGSTSGGSTSSGSGSSSTPRQETGEVSVVEEEGTPTDSGSSSPDTNTETSTEEPASEPSTGGTTDDTEEPTKTPATPSPVTQTRATAAIAAFRDVVEDVATFVEDIREIPEVQQSVDIAVPVVVASAAASTAVLVTSFSLLPYLQYLFTSPILFFARRKRRNFGVVYNAMTKMAVDLATVRLFDAATNRLVRSVVTDSEGKYFFIMNPGRYRVMVVKPGFTFPSGYLAGVKDDGAYLDVYTGQEIEVNAANATIAANIPLDPAEAHAASPSQLRRRRFLRAAQYGIAVSGVGIAAAVYALRPSTFTLVMIGVQVFVLLLVHRLARPRRPKGWGIVYDAASRKPVGNAVVRLFEPKYNKLVETTLTDNLGRYAFVLGANEYFASISKPGFQEATVRPIDYRDKKEPTTVAVDVPLRREGGV